MAQFAKRPLLIGVSFAFMIAVLMRETYPRNVASIRDA
jgi:hypothetical protein